MVYVAFLQFYFDQFQFQSDSTPSRNENDKIDCFVQLDYFLFDTKGDSYGGNGVAFDWSILKNDAIQKPFFLSGGIDSENIKVIENISPFLYAIDVNSKFELAPGLKDIELLKKAVFTITRSL